MKSLQDQLLNAGLANKKQAANAKKLKNKQVKQRKSGVVVEDSAAKKIQAEKDAKIEKDRQLNHERDQIASQKAIQAQIIQIIKQSRVTRPQNSETRFNFTDGSTIKYLVVSEEQQSHLSKGFLAIARLDSNYELIPLKAALKIQERDETVIVNWNQKDNANSVADEDDPYADFEVPDDLMW